MRKKGKNLKWLLSLVLTICMIFSVMPPAFTGAIDDQAPAPAIEKTIVEDDGSFIEKIVVENDGFFAADAMVITAAAAVVNGDGTEEDPYQISSVDELIWMAEQVNNGDAEYRNAYYWLTADIECGDQSFAPIGSSSSRSFTGQLDGQGHKISGLTIDANASYQGLFGYINGGTVKNLGLEDALIKGSSYVGGIAGYLTNGIIDNCYLTGAVVASGSEVGGIAAYSSGATVENCYNTGDISGDGFMGGIVGRNAGNSIVQNCYNTGSIQSSGNNLGGIVGINSGSTVKNCYSSGDITGTSRSGGVVGCNEASASVLSSYSTGSVTCSSSTGRIGGIVGQNGAGCLVAECVALNPELTYTGGTIQYMGRVTYNSNTSMENRNYAWEGMQLVNGPAVADGTVNNGTGLSTAVLQTAAGWPEALKNAPWQYEAGLLPTLLDLKGQTGTMPKYLAGATTVSVDGVSLDKNSDSVAVGGTTQLTATVSPENADNKDVTWASSDESVATVSNEGLVTGVGTGTATITVTTEDGSFTATCAITVSAATVRVDGVSLDKSADSIAAGGTTQLIATVTPENADNKEVTWASSDGNVATVSNEGLVTGVGTGTATITVTTVDGDYEASCAVTVSAATVRVDGVLLDKSTDSIAVGGTTRLTATVSPADADKKDVTWASSDENVATVSNEGLVTGVGTGTATITVTTVDGSYTAISAVTVSAAATVSSVLTWSENPQTTQTITWLMPAGYTSAKVQYLKESDYSDKFTAAGEAEDTGRTFGTSGTDKLFSVNLTGLAAGTTYFYRVGAEDNWSKTYNFTTAPTDTDSFSFLYLGDSQMDEELEWSDSYSEWEKLLAAAAANYPDLRFSLQVGDVTNEEGEAEAEYRHFINVAGGLFSRIPFMPAKGNHDGDFFTNFFKLPESGLEHFYSFDYGDAHFAVLDTGQNALDMATVWLRQDLQNSNSKWKFVVFHHPVYYAFDDGKTSICDSIRERWAPVFEENKVDLAFVGHQHMYMRTKPMRERTDPEAGQDLVYVMGVSGNKYYGPDAEYGYIDQIATHVSNYQVVNINGDTLTLHSVGADGQVLDTYQVNKNAAIWPTDSELSVSLQGDKATLSWPAPSGYFTRYWVYQDGELIDTVDSDVRSYTVSGLNERRNYTFKIEAGSAASPLAEEALSRTVYLVPGASDSGEPLTIEDTDFYIPIQTATDGSGRVISEPLQQITMQSAGTTVSVVIPAGVRVSGPAAWNGLMTTPAAASASILNLGTVNMVVEVGFSGGTLTFDKAVKLIFPGQAGKRAGYFDSAGTWHAINTVVSGTDAATVTTELAGKGAQEGYQNAGSDLVVWTMHFTKFVAYTPANTGGSSGSGGGSSSTEQAVTSATGKASLRPGAGGFVSLGGEASIEVPANALSGVSSLEVRVEKVSEPPAAPDGLRFLSDVYEFSVDSKNSYTFSKYVTIILSFDADALDAGETPAVYYYDEGLGRWVTLGGSVSGATASVLVNHFTKFAVLAADQEAMPPSPAQQQEESGVVNLTDIAGHWAQNQISRLAALSVVNGYPDGSFQPEGTVTRAEFVTMLVKALNPAASGAEGQIFADSAGHWAKDYITAAAANGIVSGYDADTFGPDDLITREQMAVMLVKAASLGSGESVLSFTDADQVSAWAREALAAAAEHGLMNGYPDGSFQPQGQATRAEAVTVLSNLL